MGDAVNQDILDGMTIDDLLPAVHELRSGTSPPTA